MMKPPADELPRWRLNRRQRALLSAVAAAVLVMLVGVGGLLLDREQLSTQLSERNEPPSSAHWFGTDWLGRDMFARTMAGLSLSIQVGLFGSFSSVLIAAGVGLAVAMGGKPADRIVTWVMDLFLSLPHMVTLILLAFICGGGMKGIIIGVALTHWPSLARVIRAEVLQLQSAEYVQVSRQMGKSGWWVATRHIFPHLLPQLLVGWLLLFPHAILHEAAITFLGLGLSPHQPAVGIILSESMRYLAAGMWWLAVFPGLSLLILVRALDRLGHHLRGIVDPHESQQ
jgi:peptide/nickel transport system permease protein